jgi:hypothetical protein
MQVSMEYDLALGLAAKIESVSRFKFGYFSKRARKLEKLGITGRVLGDNALHDAIQTMLTERLNGEATPSEAIPSSITRWLSRETGLEDPTSLQSLVPNNFSFVQYAHHRMVMRGGYAKAEKERQMDLIIPSGLDTIRDANRVKNSKIQVLQEKSDQTKPSAVRVRCAKRKSKESEFEDTNPTWEKNPEHTFQERELHVGQRVAVINI